MSYDEQPDGDPHGECAAEIRRLEQAIADAIADTKRLDALQAMTKGYGRGWILRESVTGRGMRLHETSQGEAHATVRAAMNTLCTGYKLADGTEVTAKQEQAALNDALNLTGAGNNPAVVRFLYRAAARLVEPGVADPGPVTGGAVPNAGNVAARMYPSSADAAAG